MSQSVETPPVVTREYVPRHNTGLQAAMYLGGGLLWLAFIAIRWTLLLMRTEADDGPGSSGMIGGLSVLGIFSMGYGVFLLRSPRRVVLDSTGLVIQGFLSRKVITWSEIASISRQKTTPLMQHTPVDVLVLKNEKGKVIAKLVDVFADFASIVAGIEQMSAAARGKPTYSREAQIQETLRGQQRTRWRLGLMCGVLAAAGLAGAIWSGREWLRSRSLAGDGVIVDARITKLYMVRVTPWIDYSYTDSAGQSHSESTTLKPDAWRSLEGQATVPVRYLPSDPAYSQLTFGQTEFEGAGGAFLAGLGITIMFGAGLAAMVAGVRDIKIEKGKLRIKRFSDVDDALELAAPAAAPAPLPPQYTRTAAIAAPVAPSPMAAQGVAVPPAPAGPAEPGKLPQGVAVVAVLGIIFGILGVMLNIVVAAIGFSGLTTNLADREVQVPPDHLSGIWALGNLMLALSLIAFALALFFRKRWALVLLMVVAALQIASTLGGIVANAVSAGEYWQDLPQAARVGAVIGLVFRLLGAAFPAFAIIVLMQRSSRDAMR